MAATSSEADRGDWVPPMKARSGPLPQGDDWAYELKWDGMRIQAAVGNEQTPRLRSLSGRDVTSGFPELGALEHAVALPAVLDGEVVVFDGDRPSFHRLQHRIHVDDPSPALLAQHPVIYLAFDLLALDGRPTVDLAYRDRRRLLEQILEDGPTWRVPPSVDGDGKRLLALAAERGLEGVVAKRLDSTYRAGDRSRDWVKVKIIRRQEFVVGGWLPGQGALDGMLGSLLLGVNDGDGDGLRYVGAVGSGIGDRERRQLDRLLRATAECPFTTVPALDKVPIWVEPTTAVEVSYGTWPLDGLLRHPVFAGLRLDVDVSKVVREVPPRR